MSRSNSEPKPQDTIDTEAEIASISRSMGKMRLMIGRRYIGRLAVSRTGSGLELSQFDAIGIVRRLQDSQEVTVGAVAEMMRLDHSRASRITADLVKRGFLRREASQEDARRTILSLTPQGEAVMRTAEQVKIETLKDALSGWEEEDLAEFARLYGKFMTSMEALSLAFESESKDQDGN